MADPAPTTPAFNTASTAGNTRASTEFDWMEKGNELGRLVVQMKKGASPALSKEIDDAFKPALGKGDASLDAKKIAKDSVTAIDNLKKLTETHKELDAFKSPLAALGQDFNGFANAPSYRGHGDRTEADLSGGLSGTGNGFLDSLLNFFKPFLAMFAGLGKLFGEDKENQTNDPKLAEEFKKNQDTLNREARAAEAAKNGAEPEKKPENAAAEQTAATPEATTTTTTPPKQAAPAPQ